MVAKLANGLRRRIMSLLRGGQTIVLLIPARTDTKYFHNYIYGKSEIRFLAGRLKFTDENGVAGDAAPFPSMLVIYNGQRKDIV